MGYRTLASLMIFGSFCGVLFFKRAFCGQSELLRNTWYEQKHLRRKTLCGTKHHKAGEGESCKIPHEREADFLGMEGE